MSNDDTDTVAIDSRSEPDDGDPVTDAGDDERLDAVDGDDDGTDRFELAARIELLADENRRLREEYARARQSQYRATAVGLAAIGTVAVLGGLVFPDAREVLVALGATGCFGALLTYYLTPSQFVAAEVGERVYAAAAANTAALVDELGLRDERVYVPGETVPARLYVPQGVEYSVPDADDSGPIVVDEESRGLLLEATGAELFREFERALTGELADEPAALATQLTDALVEQFELARRADADVDPSDGRATVEIGESAFGGIDRVDHPIPSFVAVGFAAALERPVSLEIASGDDRTDWLVTCRWTTDGEIDGERGDEEAAAASIDDRAERADESTGDDDSDDRLGATDETATSTTGE